MTATGAAALLDTSLQWSWLSPSTSLVDQPGVYPAQQGVASSTASPGARGHAAIGVYNTTLIIIGGAGHATPTHSNVLLNDVWSYDLTSMLYTWVRGCNDGITSPFEYGTRTISSADNEMPARTDTSYASDGHRTMYIYGGVAWAGSPSSSSSTPVERTTPGDMWSFDILSGQYTWLHGSWSSSSASYGTLLTESVDNTPGSRQSSSMTMIKGGASIWLFGGIQNATFTNDMWRYSIANNTWTCLFGTTDNGVINYGTRGVLDTNNIPPARAAHGMSIDSEQNIWIVGGLTATSELLNDVWKWNTRLRAFQWVAGSSLAGMASGRSYGMVSIASANNQPGARFSSPIHFDATGTTFWMYGGYGYDQLGQLNYLADIWSFNITSKWYTWHGGSSELLSVGTRGEVSNDTWPGISLDHSIIVDDADNLLLFGNTLGPTNLLFSLGAYVAPCSIGATRLTRGSTSCSACARGRYTSAIGHVGMCPQCPQGYFCAGNSAPVSCGIGSVSPIGSTQADDCTCNGITYEGPRGKDQCTAIEAVSSSSSSSTGGSYTNVTIVDTDGVDSVLLLLTLSHVSPSVAIDADERAILRQGIILDMMTLLDVSSTWIHVVSIMASSSAVTMMISIESPMSTTMATRTTTRTPAQIAEAYVMMYHATYTNTSSPMCNGLVTRYQSSSMPPMMLLAWDDGAYQSIQYTTMESSVSIGIQVVIIFLVIFLLIAIAVIYCMNKQKKSIETVSSPSSSNQHVTHTPVESMNGHAILPDAVSSSPSMITNSINDRSHLPRIHMEHGHYDYINNSSIQSSSAIDRPRTPTSTRRSAPSSRTHQHVIGNGHISGGGSGSGHNSRGGSRPETPRRMAYAETYESPHNNNTNNNMAPLSRSSPTNPLVTTTLTTTNSSGGDGGGTPNLSRHPSDTSSLSPHPTTSLTLTSSATSDDTTNSISNGALSSRSQSSTTSSTTSPSLLERQHSSPSNHHAAFSPADTTCSVSAASLQPSISSSPSSFPACGASMELVSVTMHT